MAQTAKSLTVPSGAEYQFIGRTWYGYCTTSASSSTKTVYITGFTSSDLVSGTRVVIRFQYGQTYNGTPWLNINSTGDHVISATGSNMANRYEWDAGAVIGLVYVQDRWIIEDGGHASTTAWGKTILSTSIDDGNVVAMTPYGTYLAVGDVFASQYNNEISDWNNVTTLVNTTTPSIWTDNTVTYDNINCGVINNNKTGNRIVKFTYNNIVVYSPLSWYDTYDTYNITHYILDGSSDNLSVGVSFDVTDSTITINASQSLQGAYPFKVEFYYSFTAGFVSYPIFKDTVGDIETLLASI